ncbi:hypothetical protein [Rhodococcus maanshanensis]|uniref:Uncharacterized protein n=1 Tax=Rhodococcus maanshanensis TaxID=183556 RepID=A0A1H7TTL6_9NOCA|nr:hypothetical protein [Rhodococcus maanshanensis]SEL87993.1 hypothetical protein SAMN05444583_11695 [Rhodococcus maanshanensis]
MPRRFLACAPALLRTLGAVTIGFAVSGCGGAGIEGTAVAAEDWGAPATSGEQAPTRPPTPGATTDTARIAAGSAVDPETYHDAKEIDSSPAAPTIGFHFTTPSGNIRCSTPKEPTVLLCEVTDHTYPSAAKPANAKEPCQWFPDYAMLTDEGVGAGVCLPRPLVTRGSKVLPYGSSIRMGAFGCLSTEGGLLCANEVSGHGYQLSREALRTF